MKRTANCPAPINKSRMANLTNVADLINVYVKAASELEGSVFFAVDLGVNAVQILALCRFEQTIKLSLLKLINSILSPTLFVLRSSCIKHWCSLRKPIKLNEFRSWQLL